MANAIRDAPRDQKINTYVMFGIRYAEFLPGLVEDVVADARLYWPNTGITPSAGRDIRYGVTLSAFVEFRGAPPYWLVL